MTIKVFASFFQKAGSFQRQSLWSLSADSEIPHAFSPLPERSLSMQRFIVQFAYVFLNLLIHSIEKIYFKNLTKINVSF